MRIFVKSAIVNIWTHKFCMKIRLWVRLSLSLSFSLSLSRCTQYQCGSSFLKQIRSYILGCSESNFVFLATEALFVSLTRQLNLIVIIYFDSWHFKTYLEKILFEFMQLFFFLWYPIKRWTPKAAFSAYFAFLLPKT